MHTDDIKYTEEMKKLELTKENMQQWKNVLNELMLQAANDDRYSECLTDEEWLDYVGMTPYEYLLDEISYA